MKMTRDNEDEDWKFSINTYKFSSPFEQHMVDNDIVYYGNESYNFNYHTQPQPLNYMKNEYHPLYSVPNETYKAFGIKEHLNLHGDARKIDKNVYNQYNSFPLNSEIYMHDNITYGEVEGNLTLDNQDFDDDIPLQYNHIVMHVQPSEHQVKECLIIPHPVLKVLNEPKSFDYIVVYLVCDKRMNHEDIFLTAHSAKFCKKVDIVFDNLKITNKMLKGRTKGFSFKLRFDYMSKDKLYSRIYSKPFYLWTNVRQKGFPREKRDSYYSHWKDFNFDNQ